MWILSSTRHSPWGWIRSQVSSPDASRSQSYEEEETLGMDTYTFVCVWLGRGDSYNLDSSSLSPRGANSGQESFIWHRWPCCNPLVSFKDVGPRRPPLFTHSHLLSDL